ncbi:MAG: Elongation factor G, mitochondrial [Aureobasidium pullulans]|nr:MAG: Elongation factor G, mitochondrial [Aureobasidium pullulans]
MLPSISYRAQPLSPAFGSPTARANFCEEDFVIYASSFYDLVAMLTVSSVVFYAARALRRLPKDASFAAKSLYYGLGLVGVCSSLFHGLLSYHAQMADDTSMIVATSIVLQRAMTYQKTPTFINWFSGLLLLAVITETTYHVMMDEQTVHELSFVSLIIAVAAKTRSLIKLRVQQPKDKKMLQKAVIFGCFVFGYLLWQLDFIFCTELTAIKRVVGMPWGFLLEFHGWWHILTAVGAHTFMIMIDVLTRDRVELLEGDFTLFGENTTVVRTKGD